jgi:transmembrane sensor
MGIVDRDTVLRVRHHVDTTVFTAWLQHRVMLDDTPFAEAAGMLGRHYGVRIRTDDPQLARRQITASFERQPLHEALTTLAFLLDATTSRQGDTIVFHVRRGTAGR